MTNTEKTPAGNQHLIPGVRPISERERLERQATAALQPKATQKPCDVGLFDEAGRKQQDLF